MTAYVISIRRETTDEAELALYAATAKAAGSAAGRTMRRLATSTGRTRVLKGEPIEGLSILAFASFEAAEAWFDSAEYQVAAAHLFQGADYHMMIVEGEAELFAPVEQQG